ncbi:uncharacterized protein F5147DRAFT_771402 [Suillus discolor]|uniref:Uncharacterized protein n=1 Tax=Suillus discolor TaxID=1912936 RepID=A0A9P7JWG7_9AGAM|nr:uncharacterized protein F5147DRAFT_771402 [Suillus discolor]KAG2112340.1 hypothetical protein F5147DRAFT_771402 [Suillus discolor]
MDGNFKAEHLHASYLEDEVSLMDGQGFMVDDAMYKAHLADVKDIIQCSECNNHWAVNQANASWHRLEATGIGRCVCARHGCFVLHPMVDFQKGDRGTAMWLAEGISIEEAQITLKMDVRKVGQHGTETQRLEIGQWQERLQGDIDRWVATAPTYFGNGFDNGDDQDMEVDLLLLQDDSDDEMGNECRMFELKKVMIPLPSNLGPEWCAELGCEDLIKQEVTLWEG